MKIIDMKSILNFDVLIPIGLEVIQALLLLFSCITLLRKFRLLKLPYAGMEYSEIAFACFLLFSVFFISTANIEGLFQAYKTFENQQEQVFSNTFYKFSQFFLVILLFEFLFVFIAFAVTKVLLGFKNTYKEIQEGNLPSAIIIGVIFLGFAIILQYSAKQIIEYITPQYLNFR
jgi:sterol desaturase/sphingolipid hydroxylase (fatty acid hydroxylase superfamily)